MSSHFHPYLDHNPRAIEQHPGRQFKAIEGRRTLFTTATMLGKVVDVVWSLTMYKLLTSTEWIRFKGIGLDAGGSDVYIWYRMRI
jgi:hypothetical protein